MKKTLLSFSIVLFSFTLLMAQVPLNRTVYDCNGNAKTIHDVLGSGKALIIAHKGVDCSICQGSAPGLQSWAAANKNTVEVWGAMTYKYNPNTFSPMCTATTNWKNTYNWNDIFTFPDSSRLWYNIGTPRYYVYSARDSSIVWQGSSQSTAQSRALQETVVGLSDFFLTNKIQVIYSKSLLHINQLPSSVNQLALYDLNGRLLLRKRVNASNTELDVATYPIGTYVLQVLGDNLNVLGSKKVVFY